MKTIIAGSRTILERCLVDAAIEESGFVITTVVSGKARGVDTLGEEWAKDHDIPVLEFPANWEKYGKAAGHLRNSQMALVADALVAVTNGSPGTAHMIREAQAQGLQVYVKVV